MKTNYVLIDYENVQPKSIAILDQDHFKLLIFIGATQTKIALAIATAVQKMGTRADYITIPKTGNNALDFHIAWYLGRLTITDPTAYFHIISKDTGFDPLIQHLREHKISVARSHDIVDMPLIKALTATTLAEQVEVVRTNLEQRGVSKPRTVKTLTNTIKTLLQQRLTDAELAVLLHELERQQVISIHDIKVTYG